MQWWFCEWLCKTRYVWTHLQMWVSECFYKRSELSRRRANVHVCVMGNWHVVLCQMMPLNVIVVADGVSRWRLKSPCNNVKLCVHGCNIFQKIPEFFKEVSWVTWRAINKNEIPREARIWYVNTHRFKVGIGRAGVQIYVQHFWNEETNTTASSNWTWSMVEGIPRRGNVGNESMRDESIRLH